MEKITEGKRFLPVIGSFLKEKRERQGLTQENVETETKIKRYNVARYEKGEVDMPTSKIPELCQLYRCRMAECGRHVDDEMGFYKTAQRAVKSDFVEHQYMSFAAGTPMIPVEEEVIPEEEFSALIKATTNFLEWGINEVEIPKENFEQLKRNFSFFMVAFIVANETNKARQERLLKYCNELLRDAYLSEGDS